MKGSHYSHFIGEETKAQRDWTIHQKPQSWSVAELGYKIYEKMLFLTPLLSKIIHILNEFFLYYYDP